MHHSILIIGGGNMGGAIAKALHAAPDISVSIIETDETRRNAFSILGIPTFATLSAAPKTECYLLAIKPQQFAAFADEMKAALPGASSPPLLLSIMAGIPLSALHTISPRAVRVMPNLPAVIHESMSVLCAPALDASTRALAEKLFAHIGATAWVENEIELHAVTAISGSGPAYVFAFMEAMEQAAIAQGLHAALAKKLVAQTLRGAALLADQSPETFATLRQQVTSKGGTTEAALTHLSEGQLQTIITNATAAAAKRSHELASN
jgi:pyrroline-5-carboxylate reductase